MGQCAPGDVRDEISSVGQEVRLGEASTEAGDISAQPSSFCAEERREHQSLPSELGKCQESLRQKLPQAGGTELILRIKHKPKGVGEPHTLNPRNRAFSDQENTSENGLAAQNAERNL